MKIKVRLVLAVEANHYQATVRRCKVMEILTAKKRLQLCLTAFTLIAQLVTKLLQTVQLIGDVVEGFLIGRAGPISVGKLYGVARNWA